MSTLFPMEQNFPAERNSSAEENSVAALFRRAILGGPDDADWLMIAHDDPDLVTALGEASRGLSTVIVPLSQAEWNFAGEGLRDALDWSLRQRSFRHVVWVGHSQSPKRRSPLLADEHFGEPSGSSSADETKAVYEDLLFDVQRANRRNRDAQESYANLCRQALTCPPLQHRIEREQLRVHGMFFRNDLGLFIRFDPATGSFSALEPKPR